MTEQMKKEIFQEFNSVLNQYGVRKPQDIFRLLNEYQSSHLDGIEKANNEQNRFALQRTIDYYAVDFSPKWQRSKKKEDLVFKLVNILVLDVPGGNFTNASRWTKKRFKELEEYKEQILENKSWYLQVIPESAWLIEYFEKEDELSESQKED